MEISDNKFLKKYCDYATEITDAPIVFHEFMAYALMAAATGGKVYLPQGDNHLYPNFYLILLAGSSSFRKSTSLMIAASLLKALNPNYILPSEFSLESFYQVLTEQPSGVMFYNEFKSLLGLMKRDYMQGAKAFLCGVYDGYGGHYSKTKAAGEVKIDKTFVNIWGATTEEWFVREVTGDDVGSGFLARFIFVMARDKNKQLWFPPPADKEKRSELIQMLQEINQLEGEMILTKGAKDAFIEFAQKLEAKAITAKHDYACIYNRLGDYVKKFSILEAISKQRLTISGEDMIAACKMIEYATFNIEDVVVNKLNISKFSTLKKRVFNIIKRSGSAGIMRRDLISATQVEAGELNKILGTLKEEEKILIREEKTKTKPRIVYYFKELEKDAL